MQLQVLHLSPRLNLCMQLSGNIMKMNLEIGCLSKRGQTLHSRHGRGLEACVTAQVTARAVSQPCMCTYILVNATCHGWNSVPFHVHLPVG
jgi:hypothetical protein